MHSGKTGNKEGLPTIAEQLSFYGGKRVLITGDTGFKGAWLAIWLHHLGAKVLGYALPPASKHVQFALAGLDHIITHVDGDIRDFNKLSKTIEDFQPELVFHLAAQAIVKYSYEEPKLTFDTNVGGSVNILEAVRNAKSVRSMVFITSDKCYRNKEWVWGYRENDELGGHDPYSSSKAAAELVFSAYLDSFFQSVKGLGIASARAGNVIGGGDWAQNRIIPDCMRALQSDEPIVLRNPMATRPWQHVLEPLWGYLLLGIRLWESPKEFTGSWNFGPPTGSGLTVEELVKLIIQCWGQGEYRVHMGGSAHHEARLLQLNTDKARMELHWRPRWDAYQTIEETVRWYKNVYEGNKAVEITRSQIRKFAGEAI